jgi:hypothetical protein
VDSIAVCPAYYCLVFVRYLSLPPQKARWEDLNERVVQLSAQAKYQEAIPIAQQALRVAEAISGPEDLNLATAITPWRSFSSLAFCRVNKKGCNRNLL